MTLRGLSDGIWIGLGALRESKFRTALTVLGVAVGVLVVMVMAAVIKGINSSFEEAIEAAGPRTFYVVKATGAQAMGSPLDEEEAEFFRRPPLSAGFARELQKLVSITNAYPMVDLSSSEPGELGGWMLRAGENRVEAAIYGVPPDFMQTDVGDIIEGRFYTSPEEEAGWPVAVVDSSIAAGLYAPLSAVGKQFRIGPQSFTIVGVYRTPDNLFAQIGHGRVFLPFHAAQKHLLRGAHFITFDDLIAMVVTAKSTVALQEAVDQVTGRMRALRGLSPGTENDFEVLTQDDVNDLWNQLTGVLFAVMFALSGVALMVGGIGVIAVMVVSVTERTSEVGIRKALGATRRDIMWQFLVEAATLTTVGGAFGLAIGGIIVWILANFTPIPAVVPAWSIIAALTAAALTGIVFGLYPAARASGLDPVAALRYER
ncbi:MAG: ABC transporter permease [Gemmatimonadales bacterium]|jgi:putative ABC transport system permease protein